MITEPGIYTISAAEYHANPCPAPALSSSLIKLLCQQSPAHAKAAMDGYREDSEAFDIGTIAHAILLQGEDIVESIDAKDWRTNAAKDARDAARLAGKVPLLAHKHAEVQAMVRAAQSQLDAHEDGARLFGVGAPEQTLVWREGETWCRARIDWLHADHLTIDDYKSTSATANPDVISRTLFSNGWDIQAAWYLRGLKAVTGQDAQFRFIVQETYPPFALSVVALGPDVMTLAQKKILYGLELWQKCLASGRWPAYPTRTCYASLPAFIESAWLEKELS